MLRISFSGDIMLADLPGECIARGRDPLGEFAALYKTCDINIGNLECVIATGGVEEKKPWTFRAHPRCIPVLKKHFHALSVANNHSGDFGKDALVEMFELCEKAKLPLFGGGRNLRDARQPHIVEENGIRVAILGYNEFQPRRFAATDTSPGVAWSEDAHVIEDIKLARDKHKADVVIPFMHWGWEYEQENDRQQKFARTMIDAGASMVIGGHPHVTQGIEYYQDRLIVYSLGNFVFDGFDRTMRPHAFIGWMLRLTVNKQGLVAWDTVSARLDDEGVPYPDMNFAGPCGETGDRRIFFRAPVV